MTAILLPPKDLSSTDQAPAPVMSANKISAYQWVLLSATLIALATTTRIGMIAWPFLNDSGLYAMMGRTVATGGVLYRDFYETKLPGAGLLAAGFWLLFGHHWIGYVLCQLAMAITTSLILSRIVKGLATFLFAVVFLNLGQAVYTGFQLETIQAFFEAFAALSACRALQKDQPTASFTTGIFAGLAAMAKPGGAGIALVLFIMFMLRSNRRAAHALALFLGFAIPSGATLLYTVQSGAWPYLPAVLRDIQHYATGTPIGIESILKLAVLFCVLSFPFAIRLLNAKLPAVQKSDVHSFAIAWFVVDLLAALAQRRLYPYHFLPLVCPVALLYGLIGRKATPASVALGLLPIALLSLTWEGSSVSRLRRGFDPMPVSTYIKKHTTINDAVFSDQIGRLLIETGRPSGSRLGTFFYFVNDDQAPERYCKILLSDFETRQTKYLLLARDWNQSIAGLANCDILLHAPQRRQNFLNAWDIFRKYVTAHYHLETTLDGLMIYRRSSIEPPANPSTRAAASPGRSVD